MKRNVVTMVMCLFVFFIAGCSNSDSDKQDINNTIQVSDIFSVEIQTGYPFSLLKTRYTTPRRLFNNK